MLKYVSVTIGATTYLADLRAVRQKSNPANFFISLEAPCTSFACSIASIVFSSVVDVSSNSSVVITARKSTGGYSHLPGCSNLNRENWDLQN